MCSSKKGISAHQLWRNLGFGSYRTAWFMAHRIREGMREARVFGGLGGEGKVIEADETYIGGKETNRHKSKRTRAPGQLGRPQDKEPVLSLVERGGPVASYHVASLTAQSLGRIIFTAASRKSRLHTDEFRSYWQIGKKFAAHETVEHTADEYVRGDVHTNSVENYYSILKRGIYGVYHRVSEAHLQRYLYEFDFRYSHRVKLGCDDATRAALAVKGIAGKRLTYAKPNG